MSPFVFSPPSHAHLLSSLAALHASCITNDHSIAYFAEPLDTDKIQDWWAARFENIEAGARLLVVSTDEADANKVTGAALLSTPWSQTGPFRAIFEGVWVSPDARRQGLGRALVTKMEKEAKAKGRTLVIPEAEAGGAVEQFWGALGYTKAGVVPERANSPLDGKPKDMAYYYKDLRKSTIQIA